MSAGYGPDEAPVDGDTRTDATPSDAVRRSMRGNRARDTRPELTIRRLLHAKGLRYRVNARPEPTLRRTADVLFTRARVAVLIDGCFWHRCPQHATTPRTRTEYWTAKLERNVVRDAETNQLLQSAGWTVLRYWEHEDPATVADDIVTVVGASLHRSDDNLSITPTVAPGRSSAGSAQPSTARTQSAGGGHPSVTPIPGPSATGIGSAAAPRRSQ